MRKGLKLAGIALGIIILCAGLLLVKGRFSKVRPMIDGVPVVTAGELSRAFRDHPEQTEEKYLGKTLLISGMVRETGMSIYMTPNVMLADTEEGEVFVICVLPRADTGRLGQYKKGQRVIMSGRVYRFIQDDGRVVMKECVEVAPDNPDRLGLLTRRACGIPPNGRYHSVSFLFLFVKKAFLIACMTRKMSYYLCSA